MELTSLSEEIKEIFTEKRRVVSGQQFTVSGKKEKQVFLDSCFNAIVLRHFDPKSAEKEIVSLLSLQYSNGKIPKEQGSFFTHPPLIAYAALEVFKSSRSEDFLEKIFPKLDKYYKWISAIRDPYSKNILSIIHPEESGYEDSPVWAPFKKEDILTSYANLDRNDSLFLQKEYFDVKDLFFNCVYLESLKSMEEISSILKKKEVLFYKKKHEYTEEAIKKYMYDKTANLFFSFDFKGNKLETLTPFIFLPLFSNLLSHSQALNLVNKVLLDKQQFWTEYPIPTLSFSEKKFDSTAQWKGASTVYINWLVFKGLLNYRLKEDAENLYEKTLSMISKSGFSEYYNSTTGDGLGTKNYTSSCLVLDMERSIQNIL